MSADSSSHSRASYRLSRRGSEYESVLQDDDIPLSEMDTTRTVQQSQDLLSSGQDNDLEGKQDLTDQAYNNIGKQEVYSRHYFLCYFLHVFLVAIHLVLVVLACYHPEHRIIISSASEASSIGLSGGLQAFYTLYTTLLVFVTQRLMLSTIFSGPTKLTQIHDICGAWYGLGAALSILWQQTKVASSKYSIALVTVYYIGVSVLHVASSTLMLFEPFNANVTSTVSAVATRQWPDSISKSTSLGWQATVLSLAPYMQDLYGNTTQGLVNSTLYDMPILAFVNATVNATTLNSHCGLLTNLSLDLGSISVSMTDLDPLSFSYFNRPLPNEIWFSAPDGAAQPFVTFLVTAAIEADESVGGTTHINTNGTFSSPGGVAQNFTTQAYLVACSFDSTTTTVTLVSESSSVLLVSESDKQPTSTTGTWPMFSPGDADFTNLNAILSVMMNGAQGGNSPQPRCQPVMSVMPVSGPYLQDMPAFNAYVISSLGIDVSSCNTSGTPNVEQYTGTPYLLTRDKMESVISKIAAQFVWIAGQLGKAGGAFDKQTEDSQITDYVLKWRLNINLLPVISSLCASVVLCILVVCMLWRRNNHKAVMHAAGPLEIMWFGSRSASLRAYLAGIRDPSVDGLRTSSISKTVLWTQTLFVHADQKGSRGSGDLHTAAGVPFYDQETQETLETFEDEYTVNLQPQADSRPGQPRRTWNTSRHRRWCYALHIALVALHIALLVLLVQHPEHHVIISLETTPLTTGLSALLQVTYTLYSALLVFVLQYLAFSRMVDDRRRLTVIHDVSGAWTGIGAATVVLWQQRKVASSPRRVLTVVVYLISMLVLHIASSSIMRWQAFQNPLLILQSNLALPDSSVNISQLDWPDIAIVAFAFPTDQTSGSTLPTYGLLNNTAYDIPQVSGNITISNAIVNATTFSAQCGLVPNLALLSDQLDYSIPGPGQYRIGFSSNGSGNNTFLAPPIWKDLLLRIDGQCADCPQTLFYMITTAIDIDDSVRDPVALELNWTYVSSSGASPQNSTTVTYIAACSIDASTSTAPVNTLNLTEQMLVSNQTVNTSWSVWSPVEATNLNVGMVTALSQSYLSYVPAMNASSSDVSISYTTSMDNYIMTLLGWNWTAITDASLTQPSTNPSVTLTPAQLENAISRTAAMFMWIAGQLGKSKGGFNRAVGQAFQDVVQYRLNINTIPVIFASAASFVALVVAILILGRKPIQVHPSSVSSLSVLESLWLEANSEELHSRLQAVKELDLDKLREAGMFDIRLGDVKAGPSLQTSESEELSLIDNSENDIQDGTGEQLA